MYKKKNEWMIVDVSSELPKCGLVGRYYGENIKLEKNTLFQKGFLVITILNAEKRDFASNPSHVK